ncbi:MAG: flippase [Burkholderiales bacterium]|nr:flippase [Burkholderiales bacterium]
MSLKRNTFWNLGGSLLPLLAAAAFIPYCLRHLGNEAFGVLTLIWGLIGYFSLFDFGVGRALTYGLSKLRMTGDHNGIGRVLKSGLLLTAITGTAGTLIMLMLAPSLTHHWLKISPALQNDAQSAFQIAAIGVIPTAVTSGLRGAMEGLERFAASNLNKIFLGFCMFTLPAASIWLHGNQLSHIALYLAMARLVVVVIGLLQLRSHLRSAPIDGAEIFTPMRGLVSYGFWLTVSGIISPLMVFGDRFFISSLLGAGQLALYTIPQEGLMRMLIVPAAIGGALLPMFAGMQNQHESSALYQSQYRRLALIMLGLCLFAAIIAYPGLSFWLSADFAHKALPITLILVAGSFMNGIAQLPYTMLQARGKPKLTAQFHMVELVLYIVVLYFLSRQFGLIGAALAWTARVTLDWLLLHIAARRLMAAQRH